jgi:hypothetical protein
MYIQYVLVWSICTYIDIYVIYFGDYTATRTASCLSTDACRCCAGTYSGATGATSSSTCVECGAGERDACCSRVIWCPLTQSSLCAYGGGWCSTRTYVDSGKYRGLVRLSGVMPLEVMRRLRPRERHIAPEELVVELHQNILHICRHRYRYMCSSVGLGLLYSHFLCVCVCVCKYIICVLLLQYV